MVKDPVYNLRASVARIHHSDGAVVGAGFLVLNQQVLTCAHVINQALGQESDHQPHPTEAIELDFPLIAPGTLVRAEVSLWRPVQPGQLGEDIAGLRVMDPLPLGAQVSPLIGSDSVWDHPFRIFGFPAQHDDGVWATGVLRDKLGNGWIQMDAIRTTGYSVEPGFSGAPVWDSTLSGVVGMAVAAERRRQDAKTAFMIPLSSVIGQVWSDLGQRIQSPAPRTILSKVQQIQAQALEDHLQFLSEDYQAACNQRNYALSDVDRNKLWRQMETIEQDMQQVVEKLQSLAVN